MYKLVLMQYINLFVQMPYIGLRVPFAPILFTRSLCKLLFFQTLCIFRKVLLYKEIFCISSAPIPIAYCRLKNTTPYIAHLWTHIVDDRCMQSFLLKILQTEFSLLPRTTWIRTVIPLIISIQQCTYKFSFENKYPFQMTHEQIKDSKHYWKSYWSLSLFDHMITVHALRARSS